VPYVRHVPYAHGPYQMTVQSSPNSSATSP